MFTAVIVNASLVLMDPTRSWTIVRGKLKTSSVVSNPGLCMYSHQMTFLDVGVVTDSSQLSPVGEELSSSVSGFW